MLTRLVRTRPLFLAAIFFLIGCIMSHVLHLSAWIAGTMVLHGNGRGICIEVFLILCYYGGILLGTGGLVRAYQGLVKLGLETLPVREKEASSLMTIEVEHRHFNIALRALEHSRARILDKTFASNVQIKIEIPKATEEALIANLTEKTAGGLIMTRHKN